MKKLLSSACLLVCFLFLFVLISFSMVSCKKEVQSIFQEEKPVESVNPWVEYALGKGIDVNCIVRDSRKNILVGTTYDTYVLYDTAKVITSFVKLKTKDLFGTSSSQSFFGVTSIVPVDSTSLWLVHSNQFPFHVSKDSFNNYSRLNIMMMEMDSLNAKLWAARIGSPYDSPLGSMDCYDQGTWKRFTPPSSQPEKTSVECFTRVSQSEFWLGMYHGIWIFNPEAGTWKSFSPFPLIVDEGTKDTTFNTVRQITSGAGNIWFSLRNRLYKTTIQQDTLSYGVGDGLPGAITALLWDGKKLWVGTKNGLASFSEGKFTLLEKWGTREVSALYRDPKGFLWIGSVDGKLVRYKE